MEDDGEGFRVNSAESLRGEGDLKVADLLDKVVRGGEAGGRVCCAPVAMHALLVPACTQPCVRWSASGLQFAP